MSDPTNPFAPRDIGVTIEKAHEAAEKYQKPTVIEVAHPTDTALKVPAVLGKEGLRAVSKSVFAEYLDHPERRTGTAANAAAAVRKALLGQAVSPMSWPPNVVGAGRIDLGRFGAEG